jgi:hypothetical protein
MTRKKSPLETKHLIAGGLGMLCPIPVVGEATVAYFLNPIVKQTGIFGNDSLKTSAASLAIAALMRIELYQPIYLPILDYASKFFN